VILLGQPWVSWISGLPEPVGMWLAALSPLLNLFLLAALCRLVAGRRRQSPDRGLERRR
jgi:hypothetical protein